MKLPDLPGSGSVPDVAPEIRQVGAAASEAGRTVQGALTAIGQEYVKGQNFNAQIALSQGLDSLDGELRQRPAIPMEEVKQRLGDRFAALPEQVRNQPKVPQVDPKSGQPVLDERGNVLMKDAEVPTYLVAHALFHDTAGKIMDQAAGHITASDGWQNEFRRAATGEIVQRWGKLNETMLQAYHRDLVDTRQRQILTAANSANTPQAWAGVHAMVDGSLDIFGDDVQAKVRAHVQGMQQARPVQDALLHFRTDPAGPTVKTELEDAARRLADEKQTGLLTPERRDQLANQVHAALKQVEEGHAKRTAAGIAFEITGAKENRADDHPELVNPRKAFDALDAAFAEGGKYAGRPELRADAGTLLDKFVRERNERVNYDFDALANKAMQEWLGAPDARGLYRGPSSANLTDQTRQALLASGKKGSDYIEELRLKDKANESHARNMAQLPTPEESGKALAIEYALATREKEVAALGPGRFARLVVAGEGNEALGIPAGRVSMRDTPKLWEKFSAAARPEKRQYLVKPEAVAFEEALEAFPSLKNAVQKKGEQKGRVTAPEEVRQAFQLLSDRLAKFIDDNPGTDGRGPSQDAIRAEARRQLQTVEVRDTFLGLSSIAGHQFKEKVPRVQAEAQKRAVVGEDGTIEIPEGAKVPGAAPAVKPPPVPPAAGAHEEAWIGPDGKRYAIPKERVKDLDQKKWRKAAP